MTKKDIFILLSPSIWLVCFAVLAFLGPHMFQKHYEGVSHFQKTQQNFERFATNVQAGKVQLTQKEMLEYMRVANEYAGSEIDISTSLLEVLRSYAWVIIVAIGWQVGTVLVVRNRLRKRIAA